MAADEMLLVVNVLISSTLDAMDTSTRVRPADLANWLLARGRSAVTTAEAAELMGIRAELVRVRLHSRRGEFVSPVRGLWVPVPSEYRLWGAPEGIELIDLMMRHLGVDYYVGWLSAAALHGAAHHAPQTFQVATARPVADRHVGRTDFRFLTRGAAGSLLTLDHQTRSGRAVVSSPEVTALDVATDVALAGGIDNVATVILGLADEGLDLQVVAELSSQFPAASVRRLGWILGSFDDRDVSPLREAIQPDTATPSALDPSRPVRGAVDRRWLVRVNADVDAEF